MSRPENREAEASNLLEMYATDIRESKPDPVFHARLIELLAFGLQAEKTQNLFWPTLTPLEEHVYEIRNGKTREYIMEHVKALQAHPTSVATAKCPECDAINPVVRCTACGDLTDAAQFFTGATNHLPEAEESLARIIRKCEQYWNENGVCDAEIHAALECISRDAYAALASLSGERK